MKRVFFLFLLASISTISSLWGQKTIPDITIRSLDGKQVKIRDYTHAGKVTVLSFWATWCAPCKRELDAMAELYPEWQEQYGAQVLAISIDDQRQLPKVGPMAAAQGWPFKVFSDAGFHLKNALNIQPIPHTILIDKSGNIVYEHTGYLPGDELDLGKKIAALSR
ncbi:MAG: Thiol-disulfide oxidoreductase ResA [Haliscomenobacter sp.]|jgi:cytochrome c biogenesis protein CcmG/thiol:disulfide interchange protein DsbE|nr:Thiol-disulfide oxidoreductase ResA [Haliscomenobacter sp.]